MSSPQIGAIVKTLKPYLNDLENRIDDAVETQLFNEWKDFLDGKFRGTIFSPRRTRAAAPGIAWPKVTINEGLDDYTKMALQQLAGVSAALAAGDGSILNVRSNYGTGILPSPFGVELFIMEAKHDTLPTNWPLKGGVDTIRAKLAAGVPDLNTSLAGKALEMGRVFAALVADHPKVRRHVHIYHPDAQSPMDVCELLWGSGLFTDIMDTPALVLEFLDLITQTYIRFMEAWREIIPFREGYNAHWGMLIKGCIMLRSDSAMNLSPRIYKKFIQPFDQRLLTKFGGGAVHFCGKGDHFIPLLSAMDGVTGVNTSQPEYNDMEIMFKHTVDKGISLLSLRSDAAQAALDAGRDLHGRVHSADALLSKIGHAAGRPKS